MPLKTALKTALNEDDCFAENTCIRQELEELEMHTLSSFATKSRFSLGREREEEPCDLRTCFQRDRDRIIHSKSFRRLMHKTQAFISPEGDHYRTRLTHTLEVSQIARTIARSLHLNEDLTEAIALGHDLGHTPFGHLGEDDLNDVVPGGFHHNEQSVRVVQKIEKGGHGLNLSLEVTDGILNHRGAGSPKTLEGKVVQLSDKIAYINHDIDDAVRAGIITEADLPKACVEVLGDSFKMRINCLIHNVITSSSGKDDILMEPTIKSAMYDLRNYMFKNVYSSAKLGEERRLYRVFLSKIYTYYMEHFEEMPEEFIHIYNKGESKERVVTDYIAGMTDRFAQRVYRDLKL